MFRETDVAASASEPGPSDRRALLAAVETILLGSLVLLAAALLSRRLAGAMATPLAGGWLAVLAVMVAAAARIARVRAKPSGRGVIACCLSSAACLAIAMALSLHGSSRPGLILLWATLVGSEMWWWIAQIRVSRRAAACKNSELLPSADRWLVQNVRRERHRDGREQVAGSVRVDLARGQRVAHAHVAFCPPLGGAPTIELRQAAGPPARVKLGQSLPYGARFEVKLAEPGPASVTLEYEATAAGVAAESKAQPAADLDC